MSEKKNIPVPNVPTSAIVSGNLLSNVSPPSELPNFVTNVNAPVAQTTSAVSELPPALAVSVPVPVANQNAALTVSDNFSPVIPLSKGEPTLPIRSPEDTNEDFPESFPSSSPDVETIGNPMPGSGFLTWVKGAVQTGGILHKVAEKAKSSVDSMITTLDPQMKDYLDGREPMTFVLAAEKENSLGEIEKTFQSVFGKVVFINSTCPVKGKLSAMQTVGCAAAYAAAKLRIAETRSTLTELHNNIPVIAVETYIYEAISDRWFESTLLVLSHPALGIELQCQSQGTSVASPAVAALQAGTAQNYEHANAGYSIGLDDVMAANLNVDAAHWHEAATGVSKAEILSLAAKSLAGSYKNMLNISAAIG